MENHGNLIHRFPTANVAHDAMPHIAQKHNIGDNIQLGCWNNYCRTTRTYWCLSISSMWSKILGLQHHRKSKCGI